MNLKYLGSVALSLLIMSSCQEGADQEISDETTNEEQNIGDEGTRQQQREMPGQPMQQQETVDVSEDELEQFAAVSQKLQMMRQEAQQEMMTAVQGEGLEVERFSQIQQAQQAPDQQSDATEEEMEQFTAALEELEKIQVEVELDMQGVIEEEGMSEERYQEIGMAIQSDPELMGRFQEMQQQGQPQGQQPQQGGGM